MISVENDFGGGPTDSSAEPHSGHRKSFVTTVIFSFL